jgi:trehalose 6-phosphate phosphatase
MRRRLPVPTLDVARVLAARAADGLVAIFDVDGTLAPIAPTPDAARVPPELRRALRRLVRRPDTVVGFVSGRPLPELERLVSRSGTWLAGLHGAVRRSPDAGVRRLWPLEVQRVGDRLALALASALADVRGVVIEAKGPVVAVHTRAASPPGRARVRNVVSSLRPPDWSILEGRRVVELRPTGLPTKADAVSWIAAQRPAAPILYVGDDVTDEDAFRALRRGDFPVVVDAGRALQEQGPGVGLTHARFGLPNTDAVRELVEALADEPALRRAQVDTPTAFSRRRAARGRDRRRFAR